MTTIIEKLASSMGIRKSDPNKEIAEHIAAYGDTKAVKELVENLTNKDKNIQSDVIKVLYEVGALNPELISDYYEDFIKLLDSKNNRLQWGGMAALSEIVKVRPGDVYKDISKLKDVAGKGSVITKDGFMRILVTLSSIEKYKKQAFKIYLEQLKISPANQLPMYAEFALPVIAEENKDEYIEILKLRLDDNEKESKRKRVEKIIKKLQ